MMIYIVGGAVRDAILNVPSHDIDYVVVGATPQEMLDLGYKQVGADFPVFLNECGDEYALARTERKTGIGYKGFDTFFDPTVTLEEDLQRRDLTLNAMAVKLENWNEFKIFSDRSLVIDPHGGLQDIDNKVLKHTSDHFIEDPVRILRIARFHAKYKFNITKQTMSLLTSMVSNGDVDHLVPERIWAEMEKAIKLPNAILFFWVLHRCNALNIIVPRLSKSLTLNGISIRAATLRDYTFVERCMLIFGFMDNPTEVLTKLKAPNSIINRVEIFNKTLLWLDTKRTPVDTLQLIKSIDALKNPCGVYMISIALGVSSFTDCIKFDQVLKAINAIKDINFSSLDDKQQKILKGSNIGKAIDVLRLEAINNI